jgi:hypothetical protein
MGNPIDLLTDSLSQLPWETIGVWIAALLTLATYSYLAGDNRLYSLIQHVFVGMAMGYAVVLAWQSVITPRVSRLISDPSHYWYYVAFFALGLGLLGRGIPKVSRLGDIPLAYLFGIGAGLAICGAIAGSLVPQMRSSMQSLTPSSYGTGAFGVAYALDAALVALGAIATLAYFYFGETKRRGLARAWHGAVRISATVGRLLIMTTFGALFASIATGRIALLIGRLRFLLENWLNLTGG